MSDKITLDSLVNLQNETTAISQINSNNSVLTTAINNTLSRDGTSPNYMEASLDMNSNRILNLPLPVGLTEPLRLQDTTLLNGGGSILLNPLPSGGTAGQVLVKNTSTNFDASWGATGSWVNTRVSKTANYTVASGDKASTIALGGSALFTLTMSAASGYATNFFVVLVNEDPAQSSGGHAKIIAINGITNFFLYPGQSIIVFAQNNVWKVLGRQNRWLIPEATTLYVNGSSGSDTTSDGLSTGAGAFATIQHACNIALANLDCAYQVTVKVATGSYAEQISINAPLTGAVKTLALVGDTTTPTNVVIQLSGDIQVAIFVGGGAVVSIDGFALRSSGTNSTGIDCFNGSFSFQHVDFGSMPGTQSHILIGNGCVGSASGTYTISGGSGSHLLLLDGSFTYIGPAVSCPNAMTMTNNFAIVDHGFILFDGTTPFTGAGSGAGCTGSKYSVNLTGAIFLNGSTLPGATGGTTSYGGMVQP